MVAILLALPTSALLPGQPASAAEAPSCHGAPATIVGTSGDDRLVGTDGADVIVGRGGNDRIWGAAGNDLVCGGAGADTLAGGRGDDELYGGRDEHAAPHQGRGWVKGDVLEGGPGDDLLAAHVDPRGRGLIRRLNTVTYRHSGGPAQVDLTAGTATGDGHDTIVRGDRLQVVGSRYDDELMGSAGRDVLDGLGGDDRLAGRGRADVLLADAGDDTLSGGRGEDLEISVAGVDTLFGDNGVDWLIAASSRSATVHGGPGFDDIERYLTGGETGVLDGGPGGNQLELSPQINADRVSVSVDRPSGTAFVQHDSETTTATFSDFHGFTLWGYNTTWHYVGTDDRDFVQVLDGPLVASTLGGDDFMIGGSGDDTLDGGDGTDSVWGGEGHNSCLNAEKGDCSGYPWDHAGAAGRVLPRGRTIDRAGEISDLRPALGQYAKLLNRP